VAAKNPFDQFDEVNPFDQFDENKKDVLTKATDFVGGLTNTAARWATLGLTEPVSAAGRATVQKAYNEIADKAGLDVPKDIKDKSWTDLYQQNLKQQRANTAAFAAEHPYANTAAAIPGALSVGAPAAGTAALGYGSGLLSRIARSALTGGELGGVSGFANSNAQSLPELGSDTAKGAGFGLGVGGALPVAGAVVGPTAASLARRFIPGSVDRQAATIIGNRLAQDFGPGALGVQRAQNELMGAPSGVPLTIMDTQGANTLGLAGKLARLPGESRSIITDFLENRLGGTGQRLAGYIDRDLSGANAFHTAEDLSLRQRVAAKPLYEKAYNAPPLNPDTIAEGGALDKFMSRDSMKAAAINALKIAREEGRDPFSLGITFNEAGEPIFEKVPSWQTLDYVKRGLDDHLDQFRDAFGRLNLAGSESGKAIDNTRKQFLKFLDENNPDLADARAAWAGPAQSKNAMALGASFREMRPEEIQKTLSNMSPSEQEFFRVGAADALRTKVAQTASPTPLLGPTASYKRGAGYQEDQLRAVFPNADDVIKNAASEQRQLGTAADILANSATAKRLAEDTSGSNQTLQNINDLMLGIAALKTGDPLTTTWGLQRLMARLNAPLENSNNPEVAAAAARMLTTPNTPVWPGASQALNALTATPPTGLQLLLPPTTEAAGSLYPQYKLQNP